MTDTPRGAPELVSGQAIPETTVNEQIRRTEAGAGRYPVADRVTAPPGSCADGATYIIIATATGAFTGKENQLATAVGVNAASGWLYRTPGTLDEGVTAYVQDENAVYLWGGASWAIDTSGAYTDEEARDAIGTALVGEGVRSTVDDGGDTITLRVTGIAPSTETGTTYTADADDAGRYIQFTNAASIAFTIPPNASVAFPIGTVVTIEQNAAGVVTITAGAGVTLNSRGGLLATAGQYAVAQIKKVATNTWTVIGDVA